jgi:hypothetical protein
MDSEASGSIRLRPQRAENHPVGATLTSGAPARLSQFAHLHSGAHAAALATEARDPCAPRAADQPPCRRLPNNTIRLADSRRRVRATWCAGRQAGDAA